MRTEETQKVLEELCQSGKLSIYDSKDSRWNMTKAMKAICKGVPIVIAYGCVCDFYAGHEWVGLKPEKMKEYFKQSATRFIGFANNCNSKELVESSGKTWIELPNSHQLTLYGGMSHEAYQEAMRIAEQVENAKDLGERKFYQGLLKAL